MFVLITYTKLDTDLVTLSKLDNERLIDKILIVFSTVAIFFEDNGTSSTVDGSSFIKG